MKRVFSISMIVLMLAAMLHLSVATHYCSGKFASAKISLSGKTTSCGMKSEENSIPYDGVVLSSHCCKNQVATYGISSTYFPSFSFVPDHYQQNIQQILPADLLIAADYTDPDVHSGESPPGQSFYHSVILSQICLLRI